MVHVMGNEQANLHGIKKFIDRSVGLFRKAKISHGIATEVRGIKRRVKEVAKRHDRYKISGVVAKRIKIDPRLLTRYMEVTELVGIDEARDELVKTLEEENEVSMQQNGKIVSIVGFGGLGKATLANAVYEKMRAKFDCCAFVSVSQTPDSKKLFKGLLNNLGKNTDEHTLDEEHLIRVLREFLQEKSMFPEDFEIDKDQLISMWVAEGFIQCEKQGKSLFELGETYLDELINRSMIQPIHNNFSDMVYSCRIHDMVLNLICSLSSEENFVTVLNNMDQASPSNTVRRFSIQNGKENNIMAKATFDLQHARSLVIFPSIVAQVPALESCRVLRVLELKGCNLSQANSLKGLGNLYHLRYLGLCSTRISQLPEEVGNLQFLQTLNICNNNISILPSSVIELRNLMCLYIDGTTRVPNGIGNLSCLEQMFTLAIDGSTIDIIEELGKLIELRLLHIKLDKWNGKLLECLCKLEKIQELTSTQHRLSIAVRELHQADLQILGRLPALRSLGLEVDNKNLNVLQAFVVGAGWFPCPVCCYLRRFVWPMVFEQGAMPRLRDIRFFSSYVMRESGVPSSSGGLNLGLGNLPSLQRVDAYLLSEGVSKEEAEKAGAALRHAAEMHPNNPRHDITVV
ncbi:unnamed protein product [Urochloa decumbens]|uniref:NB-ARC domain-containing protein n=1 Tax=Urochloa decumbens TaxID=240449 RepID=A0ABC9AS01_9POAL